MRPFQGWAAGLLLTGAVLWATPASACPDAEAPCQVADGDYCWRNEGRSPATR